MAHPEVWSRWALDVREAPNPESSSTLYAARVWPCALAMAAWLERMCRSGETSGRSAALRIRGQHVLELGAGLAVPSLVCAARLGAASITVTDGREGFATCARALGESLARNAWSLDPKRIHLAPLDFRESVDAARTPALSRPIDVILELVQASDLCYSTPEHVDVVATIAACMRVTGCGCCLLAYQERSSKRSIQHLLPLWGLEGRLLEHAPDYDCWIWQLSWTTCARAGQG